MTYLEQLHAEFNEAQALNKRAKQEQKDFECDHGWLTLFFKRLFVSDWERIERNLVQTNTFKDAVWGLIWKNSLAEFRTTHPSFMERCHQLGLYEETCKC